MKQLFFLISILLLFISCKSTGVKPAKEKLAPIAINFSPDSAYQYTADQVAFGPRVPNTSAQLACSKYLIAKLKAFGALVTEQHTNMKAFNGTDLKVINIVGSYNPESTSRILLLAHWDSRPWADHDPKVSNHKKPVTGANDGASGVGVLLEIARQLSFVTPSVGVDILFVDAEDYGATETSGIENSELTWCLGTQYWAQTPHVAAYSARYAVLLDMVGGKGAKFYREQISDYYAPKVVSKIWTKAEALGLGNYFVNSKGGAITDDHVFVNQIAGIPCVDIIQYDPNSASGFADHWHTINDTMENIDKNTLQAVGITLLNILYDEK